ncbi:MAG: BTAD domain-containing putative transcriptional regulator [Lachnospiraceae bacterium]
MSSLGKFQLSNQNACINDDSIRSDRLTKLLVYFILYRHQNPSLEELSCALWQENETDNPMGALKNLVYRLRTVLKKQFGEQAYIITSRGSYHWNPKVEVSVDVEELEQLYQNTRWEERVDIKIQNYEKIISLYQGEFMPKAADMHWVMTLSVYYHSIFLNSVKALAELYWKREQYQELERVTIAGIRFEQLDEELYSYQIRSLVAQKKVKLASSAYEKARNVLYKELGMEHTRELENVHDRLLRAPKQERSVPLEQVRKRLAENRMEGAFLCSYPVFQEIYHQEIRRALQKHQKQAGCLVLLTVNVRCARSRSKQALRCVMEQMEEAMRVSLREGNVVTRYSSGQYLLFLDCDAVESKAMTKRVTEYFWKRQPKHSSIDITMEIEEIMGEEEKKKRVKG